MSRTPVRTDLWARLRQATDARIGLGRSGGALPTNAMLELQHAHALARDAVHAPLDVEAIVAALDGLASLAVASQAAGAYLTRPDLGRKLTPSDAERLVGGDADLAIVLGDGLSAGAVAESGPPLVHALLARLPRWTAAPIVVARQARVALGDEIGARLGVQVAVVLIGERPGLSAPTSLGAYITWNPEVGRTDAERNCVSNIRPAGLSIEEAAGRIAWLVEAAQRLRLTGVGLKDASPDSPLKLGGRSGRSGKV
jgi:ethanolamine ammonia-lyase small subunit